ncbi:mitochondrial carrier domain-containing protein [Thamnocephalis sphaerospora]|uniref:Mitochondrial carrier domain-containing protein n=1 Tax=Thamnocephalis sphaerospora TaxID=78915 RepID=A0A4P9XLK4_9FUNG|nr:mitochondrial carrier domain-containing protein [Thamnocephalis sphaerospora]|eukprot:RKP06692.1 mitochondrial carrier domain-containing protein [Thamnocephalis sphaerospora]
MYPLDVVKTRFQLQVGKGGADGYTSIADCLKKIVRNEGPAALYRGILPPIAVEAPKRAVKFAANEQYTLFYKRLFGMDRVTQPLSILTGMSAGATEAFLVVSFELVKIRLQDKNNAGKYSGTMDAVKKIYAEEGASAFVKGLESCLWRHAIWSGGYFGVIHGVRSALPEAHSKEGVLFRNFVAGAIGGTVGTMLNTPFDVVKTRVQGQLPGQPAKYGWAFPALRTIAKEEGFGALYKGFAPKVLRLGPGGGILLVVFDQVSGFIRKHLL